MYITAPKNKVQATSRSRRNSIGWKNILAVNLSLCGLPAASISTAAAFSHGAKARSKGSYFHPFNCIDPFPAKVLSVSGSKMNNKLRAMPPSNVRSQKIYLNPRVPANNPPMTGPIAVENCRTKTMALAHEKAAGYVERLTSGKCTDETPSLISRSNVCNYTGPLETLVRVSFGSVALLDKLTNRNCRRAARCLEEPEYNQHFHIL